MTRAKFAAIAALVVVTAACADGPLQVSNIQLGRSLNPDNSIASPSTLFKRSETIYVSVLTSAAGLKPKCSSGMSSAERT